MDVGAFDKDFAEVEEGAEGAHGVAGGTQGGDLADEAEIKQDGGKEAEAGEGGRGGGIGPEGVERTDAEADEQAEIPTEGQEGGEQREQAEGLTAARGVAIEQQKEVGKDDEAGEVADDVDPMGAVEVNFRSGHCGRFARLRGRGPDGGGRSRRGRLP